jgi:hypothetical protein
MGEPAQRTLRRVVWRRVMDDRSFEECAVTSSPDGFGIAGRLIVAEADAPLVASYAIACDRSWSARSVTIEQRLNDTARRLTLARAGQGWLVDGARDTRLDGCTEPDLGLTPSTNALAIRRLGLVVGQSADITCAWSNSRRFRSNRRSSAMSGWRIASIATPTSPADSPPS